AARAASSSAGEYADPSRLQATRWTFGAMAAVGSSCSSVSRRTTSSTPVGRSASSSWARTAMRRASVGDNWWTVTCPRLGERSPRADAPRTRSGKSGRAHEVERRALSLLDYRGEMVATLPVLPLADAVLLPGMVIPVTLDSGTQAAIDAARAAGDNTVVAVPRIDGEYGPAGTTALVEKVGRLPTGEPAAVIRGLTRAHIGTGVSGPGAALWVEVVPFTEPAPAGRARELAREYRTLVTSLLQRRGAWQVIDA